MERTVLHVDCNKFYASVECLHRPELRDKPVAVGGSTESRHGIILTKNEIASRYGLVAGEPLWQARQKCPQLVVVPPNFPLYMRFSKMARRIYEDYSDYIEPFGLDENWLDVTGDDRTGEQIAQEIRRRVKAELGITVSVGVSFNKIFAKLGSDYKKPDAVTVISRENYHRVVWPLRRLYHRRVGGGSVGFFARSAGQERADAPCLCPGGGHFAGAAHGRQGGGQECGQFHHHAPGSGG